MTEATYSLRGMPPRYSSQCSLSMVNRSARSSSVRYENTKSMASISASSESALPHATLELYECSIFSATFLWRILVSLVEPAADDVLPHKADEGERYADGVGREEGPLGIPQQRQQHDVGTVVEGVPDKDIRHGLLHA